MLKNISRLEHKIGDRVFHLFCDSDSPLHEVQQSVLAFLKFLGKIEDAAKEAQEQVKVSEDEKQDIEKKESEDSHA